MGFVYEEIPDTERMSHMRKRLKRSSGEAFEAHDKAVHSESDIAKFNSGFLRKLEKAFIENPEVDLLSKLVPSSYSAALENLAKTSLDEHDPLLSTTTSSQLPDVVEGLPKHLQYLQRSGEVHLKSPLATSVKRFFHRDFSPRNVITTLGQCELIYQDIGVGDRMVLKLNEDTIAKIVPGTADTREYSTLTYLDRHYPEFPAPKPRGMMQISGHNLIFMSYIPGETLEKTWSSLDQKQKTAVSAKLDHIFSKLRSQLHQHPQGQAWGGVGGKTCMDHRRTFWESDQVILGPKDFENFFFSQPKWGSKIWITFLRNIYALPEDEQSPQDACVLTHGDLKLANIMVQRDQDGEVNISGIVDWEHSGFYPAYWEAVKVTNGMTPQETSDWYLHLPAAISPLRYPKRWLLDLFWDKHVC